MAERTSFSCGSKLDISQAQAIHKRVIKALSKSSTIELKADQVEKADTSGLQIFVALQREVALTGGELVWKRPSQPLIDTAKLLGLDQLLHLTNSPAQ